MGQETPDTHRLIQLFWTRWLNMMEGIGRALEEERERGREGEREREKEREREREKRESCC